LYNITYKPLLMAPVLAVILTMIGGPQEIASTAVYVIDHVEQTAFAQNTSNTTLECSAAICDTQGFKDLGSVFSKTTGYSYNELGVFIPWGKLCERGQGYLMQPCSNLVDPATGLLTNQGDKALSCIIHGVGYGSKLNSMLGFDLAKTLLSFGASLTGCGGFVDLNTIQNSDMVQMLLRAVAAAG
jgi:hypothetical protein